MREEVRKELIERFEEAKDAIEKNNINKLDELSNHTIHITTIYSEPDAIMSAILFYSLSKVLEKSKDHNLEDLRYGILENVKTAINLLNKGKDRAFHKLLEESLKFIKEFDKSFSRYAEHILIYAKAQKGMKVYEHGASLTQIEEMLGISKWDLMEKAGSRKSDEFLKTKSVKSRITTARRLLE